MALPPLGQKKKRARYKKFVTDATAGNPKMGKYPGKKGYAIPYSDDTNKSPYKRGNRGGYPH
jgi:hypothetical protein